MIKQALKNLITFAAKELAREYVQQMKSAYPIIPQYGINMPYTQTSGPSNPVGPNFGPNWFTVSDSRHIAQTKS